MGDLDTLLDLAGQLRPSLPSHYRWLRQEDLRVVAKRPIIAGGFADVIVGEMDDQKVAIKSYRCYESADHMPAYTRFCHDVLACCRLPDNHMVPFVGVYSTREHPFALVFTFMENLDLEEYLRNNPDVRRLNLLLGVARGVQSMHSHDIIHGNLKIQNILVDADGCIRIAGLGAASILPAVSGVYIDRFFHGAAPELIDPQRFGFADVESTKASDIYAFGIIAWQIFAERVPFAGEHKVTGVISMLEGQRPGRPDHPELSGRLWKLIQACWKSDPARRMSIGGVVAALETELSKTK